MNTYATSEICACNLSRTGSVRAESLPTTSKSFKTGSFSTVTPLIYNGASYSWAFVYFLPFNIKIAGHISAECILS